MNSENGIVILIGNNGSSFFVKNGKETKSGFLEVLNDESKQKLQSIFQENPNLAIYVILDTLEQSYKKKTYPSMKIQDFERVAKRDLATEGDKDSLKNFLLLKRKESKSKLSKQAAAAKKIECMFITCANSVTIINWLEFLYSLPNRLCGLYMLPLETFSIHKMLGKFLKENFKDEEKNSDGKKDIEITCFVSQTKCGGTRQMVFADSGLIFTRVVNYNFSEKGFAEKYFQDLASTFEYLKRLYVDLTIHDFKIINILPESFRQNISSSKTFNANYVNCLPSEMGKHLGIKDNDPDFFDFLDSITARIFLRSKKVLKFTNIKIKVFDGFYNTLTIAKIAFASLFTISIISVISAVMMSSLSNDLLRSSETKKIDTEKELEATKILLEEFDTLSPDGKKIGIKEIIEIGKVNELLEKYTQKPWDNYDRLAFLLKNGLKVQTISYESAINLPSPPIKKIKISGLLLNESGDIDILFKKYDDLLAESDKSLNEDKSMKYSFSQLPKSIDFNKKYYDFPIDITLESKQ